jgi:hypothetical protein
MRFLQISFILLLFIGLSACATPEPEGELAPPSEEQPPPSLAGNWQASSDDELFNREDLGTLQYLRFTETTDHSGRLEVYRVHTESNMLACDQLVYTSVAGLIGGIPFR